MDLTESAADRKGCSILVRRFVLILALAAQVWGEDLPNIDSSVIYGSFFRNHDAISNSIESVATTDETSRKNHVETVSKEFRIEAADHMKLAAISHWVADALARNDAKLKAYLDETSARKDKPDKQMLRKAEREDQYIISAGIRRVQTELSRSSWLGLHAYLNEEYRKQIHVVQMVVKR